MGAKIIREIRFRDPSTFSKTFTNAASATWAAGTATKARVTAYDDSGLVYPGEMSPVLQSHLYAKPAPIPLLRRGNFSFSTFLGAAESDETANPIATLLSKFMGGLKSPSARTDTAETGSTTTVIKATSHGLAVGDAVLMGTRGDARGNGEVRRIKTITNADAYEVWTAFSNAPSNGDTFVNSTTVYLDPTAATTPLDFLAIGHDTEDQRQMIGCLGPFAIESANPGELPQCNFNLAVGDWQWVPSNERDQLEPSAAHQGNGPPADRGMGGLFFGDSSSSTRNVFKTGNLAIPEFLNFGELPDANGINGLGGYEFLPPENGIQATFDMIFDQDFPGTYDDFANEAGSSGATLKQLLLQWGHAAQRCAAISIPRCYLVQAPVTAEINGQSALSHALVADSGTSGTELADSALSIHFF